MFVVGGGDERWQMLPTYEEVAEMAMIGADCARGDESVDTAVRYCQGSDGFLAQDRNDRSELATGYSELSQFSREELE